MKILVAGAAGFLGRAICRAAMARGDSVTGVYRRNRLSIQPGCRSLASDEVVSINDSEFDVAIVCAGSYASPHEELLEANVRLTDLIHRRMPATKIVFVSSIAVYGNQDGALTEASTVQCESPYGCAKLAGEFVVSGHPRFGIVRPVYLFGPEIRNQSFLPTILKAAKDQRRIIIHGDGSRAQDYLHVDDAARLCLAVSLHPSNGIFLAASGRSLSNLDIAKAAAALVPGCRIEFQGVETARTLHFDPSRTRKELSWAPLIPLDGESLQQLFGR